MLAKKKLVSVKFNKTELKERNKSLGVLYDILDELTSSMSLTEVLDRSVLKVERHFGVDAVRIYLTDKGIESMTLVAYKGLSKGEAERLGSVSMAQSFSGRATREKSFIAQKVVDLPDDGRRALLEHVGFKAIVCVPLIVRDEVVGVLNLGFKRMISLNVDEIDLLMAIGNQIAVFIKEAQLFEEIRDKAEEIQRKKDDLEFFACTVAHDLKNPAVAVLGFSKLLSDKYGERLDEKGKKYCRYIKRAAQQIESFIQDINEYVSSGKVSLSFKRVNVGSIVRRIKEDLSEGLCERSIDFVVTGVMPIIVADGSAMPRVFKNLIDNALKHGGKDLTKIEISYREDDKYHVFAFNNNGLPIPKSGSDGIFGMFQKHPNSRGSEGSGLGLAIVKQIVEAHGGKVWFDSGPVKGTTFYVSVSKSLEKYLSTDIVERTEKAGHGRCFFDPAALPNCRLGQGYPNLMSHTWTGA